MWDAVMLGVIFVGAPFIIIAIVSWVIHYFVALTSRPTERAAWTVGIAFVVAVVAWLFSGEGAAWQAPLAALPGGLIAFWWWRDDFRRDWIDDAHGVPEGVELANTNWRIGLVGVVTFIALAGMKAMLVQKAVN